MKTLINLLLYRLRGRVPKDGSLNKLRQKELNKYMDRENIRYATFIREKTKL